MMQDTNLLMEHQTVDAGHDDPSLRAATPGISASLDNHRPAERSFRGSSTAR
jgi:hypothetical protein